MMAGRGIQGPSAIETRGFIPGLSRKIVLGTALVLAVFGALVVWAGAAAVDRLAFESMRQRGASLATIGMQFCLMERKIATTISGAATANEIEANVRAMEETMNSELLRDVWLIFEPVRNVTWGSGNWVES